MLSFGYTTSLSELREDTFFQHLPLVQFTLNGRMSFFKRIQSIGLHLPILLLKEGPDIIIHYDFVHLPTKYLMFTPSIRQQIIRELVQIQQSVPNQEIRKSNLLGIVLHADKPFPKYVSLPLSEDYIEDHYRSSIWDKQSIREHQEHIYDDSLLAFYEDYTQALRAANVLNPVRLYLENTTKVGPHGEGSLGYLVDFLHRNPLLQTIFGICYDTEHHFAYEGELVSTSRLSSLANDFSLMVHLNAIPPEVKPCSCLDRHSITTLFACSQASPDYYLNIAKWCDDNYVPVIREIHTDTIKSEFSQLQALGYSFTKHHV